MASSSRSSTDIWTLKRQQNYVDLLTLLQRGRNNGHLYRYRDDIEEIYKQLDRYDPAKFEILMTNPVQLDLTIASLEDLLERRSRHNPSINLSVKDLETFDIYKSFIVALESFKMGHGGTSQIERISKQLGFSPDIANKLITNPKFLDQTLTIMNGKIQQWLNTPAGKIVDLDPRYRSLFSYDKLVHAMFTGTFDLQTTALLSNPDGVKIAQFYTGFPMTGIKEQFFKDYNTKYYTLNCDKYNMPGICRDKGLKFGDQQRLDKILANLNRDNANNTEIFHILAEGGHGELIERAAQKYFDFYYPSFETPRDAAFSTYRIYQAAAMGAATGGHLELVKDYVSKLEMARDVILGGPPIHDIQYDENVLRQLLIYRALEASQFEIVKYLYQLNPTLNDAYYSPIMVKNGDLDLIKWMDDNGYLHLETAFEQSVKSCKVEIFDYLLPKILDANPGGFYRMKDSYLDSAIGKDCVPITQTLVKAGARAFTKYTQHTTLYQIEHFYAGKGRLKMLKPILDSIETDDWPDINQRLKIIERAIVNDQLKTAVYLINRWNKNYRKIKRIVMNKIINFQYVNRIEHKASEKVYEDVAKQMKDLLDLGLDPSPRDIKNVLDGLAHSNEVDVVKVLVDYVLYNDINIKHSQILVRLADNIGVKEELTRLGI